MTKAERTEPKSGFLTSEFLLSLSVVITATILCALRIISDEMWMVSVGVNGVGYTAARAATKISGK